MKVGGKEGVEEEKESKRPEEKHREEWERVTKTRKKE